MWFRIAKVHHPHPCDSQFFIDNHVIDIVCSADGYRESVAGRIAIDYFDLMRAQVSGEDVHQIADADSGGWEELCALTLDLDKTELGVRKDFNVQDCVFGFALLYEACFHPSLRRWEPFILDAVCKTFPAESLIFTFDDRTNLTLRERAALGFRRVAQTSFQFRPNMLKTDYDPASESDDPNCVTVPSDAGDYVNERWESDNTC